MAIGDGKADLFGLFDADMPNLHSHEVIVQRQLLGHLCVPYLIPH